MTPARVYLRDILTRTSMTLPSGACVHVLPTLEVPAVRQTHERRSMISSRGRCACLL